MEEVKTDLEDNYDLDRDESPETLEKENGKQREERIVMIAEWITRLDWEAKKNQKVSILTLVFYAI